ncbi:MAG: hypothetical protein ABIN18_14675 [Pseudomonadota bacterium]
MMKSLELLLEESADAHGHLCPGQVVGVDKQPNSCTSCHHNKDTPLQDLVTFLEAAKKADMPKPFTAHKRP